MGSVWRTWQDRIADMAELMKDVGANVAQQSSALVYVLKRDEAASVAGALTRRGAHLSVPPSFTCANRTSIPSEMRVT